MNCVFDAGDLSMASPNEVPNDVDVLLIGCGGTIACEPSPNGELTDPSIPIEELLDKARDGLPSDIHARPCPVQFLLDSTNMHPGDWSALAEVIIHALFDDVQRRPDAIVVTHGTDTMAYTACALALAFGRWLPIPIILTGSQLPIDEQGSDGRLNLQNAIRVAAAASRQGVREVMISMWDRVLRGSRACKRSESEYAAFDSPGALPLATIKDKIVFHPHAWRGDPWQVPPPCWLRHRFSRDVVHQQLVPGIREDHLWPIVQAQGVGAIVLETFGSGNTPSDAQRKYDITAAIKWAYDNGRPVVLASPFRGGRVDQVRYKAGIAARNAHAIPAIDMSIEMTVSKLMWILGQGIRNIEEIRELLHLEFVDEIDGASAGSYQNGAGYYHEKYALLTRREQVRIECWEVEARKLAGVLERAGRKDDYPTLARLRRFECLLRDPRFIPSGSELDIVLKVLNDDKTQDVWNWVTNGDSALPKIPPEVLRAHRDLR